MANVISTIKVDWGYRPCIVNGKKGLFHRWVGGLYGPEQALVELEDGTVISCKPKEITFCDNPFPEYNFERKEDKERGRAG